MDIFYKQFVICLIKYEPNLLQIEKEKKGKISLFNIGFVEVLTLKDMGFLVNYIDTWRWVESTHFGKT